jgi:hypothetical protein
MERSSWSRSARDMTWVSIAAQPSPFTCTTADAPSRLPRWALVMTAALAPLTQSLILASATNFSPGARSLHSQQKTYSFNDALSLDRSSCFVMCLI